MSDEPREVDVLVVGAGYAGSIMAERLASTGCRVHVIDRRDHIAGNAYDYRNEHGIRMHRYGPHLFHANSERVVEYLSRFTTWWPYEHRVLARVRDKLVPIPINRTTLNELYGLDLPDEAAAEAFLAARAEPVEYLRNSEDAVVSKVGRELYELFFRGYTTKQWARDPSQLNASVCARIPVRFNVDDRYFTDSHQALPADGYTAMFERILDHPNITVELGVTYADVRDRVRATHLVWTGAIDEFYGHRFGKLPYRSLRFELVTEATPDGERVQPVAQVNYPGLDVDYTRITEFAHLSDERHEVSTLAYEYPTDEGDPYYPVPAPENQELYARYEQLAKAELGVTFVGRLATYKYLNMDQVVGQALVAFDRLMARGGVPVAAAGGERGDACAS